MMASFVWILWLSCVLQKVSAQPTNLNDVTLCSDVRDYTTVTRTLDLVVQELKSLRISLTSMQKSQEKYQLNTEKTLRNLQQSTQKPTTVNDEERDRRSQKSTEQITGQINSAYTQLASRLNLMTSSLRHHSDKIDLDYQKLRFYVSQKFSSLFSSIHLSGLERKQLIHSINTSMSTNIDNKIRQILVKLNTTHQQLERFFEQVISDELSNTRVSIEEVISSSNQMTSSAVNTLTSSTMDGLVHIKDILNHHHVTTRLMDGTSIMNGRVEVFLNGVWGTVCDDDWDDLDAAVVCRKVGFCNGTALHRGFYGPGTGPVVLDNVACGGDETDLFDCPHNGLGIENCDRFEDAAVQCNSCD